MKSWSTPWRSGSSGTITAVTTTARTSAGTRTRVGSGRHWATWSTYIAAARDHCRTGLSQVKDEAEQHCNTKFDYNTLYGAVLVATRDIWLGPTPTELYINYGYRGKWPLWKCPAVSGPWSAHGLTHNPKCSLYALLYTTNKIIQNNQSLQYSGIFKQFWQVENTFIYIQANLSLRIFDWTWVCTKSHIVWHGIFW